MTERHVTQQEYSFPAGATLRGGHAGMGLVKNRRRNVDHYCVQAKVAPEARRGQISGHISVRTRPTREEVTGAEAVYRRFREGYARGPTFYRGLVLRSINQAGLNVRTPVAEQSLAASRQMRSQAGWLARAVEVFRDG